MPDAQRAGKHRRNRYRFTREDCQRGYVAAWDKCAAMGWEALAWFTQHVRKYYRKEPEDESGATRRTLPRVRRHAGGPGRG